MSTTKPLIVVALALLGAGCGGSAKPPATVGQSPNDPGAAAYRYSDCMRSHGVSSFPDPHVHINGNHVSVIQSLPPSAVASPRFKSAQHACQGIIPGPSNMPTPDSPRQKAALLAFARCMRDRGVSGFPDPNPQGQITSEMLSSAGFDLHAPSSVHAALSCVSVTHGLITAAQVETASSGAH